MWIEPESPVSVPPLLELLLPHAAATSDSAAAAVSAVQSLADFTILPLDIREAPDAPRTWTHNCAKLRFL
jgi:hypothetical protein